MPKGPNDYPGSTSGTARTEALASGKRRNKTVYTHVMTPAEKFALRQVLNAKSACTQLAIAIQEGKAVDPTVIHLCGQLYMDSSKMLFVE